MYKRIFHELKEHLPFTLTGSILGVVIVFFLRNFSYETSYKIFYIVHPGHVFLSAFVTTSMYRIHKENYALWKVVLIGYIGSIGIATLSNSIIPYICELLLKMPLSEPHIGFLEEFWIVNSIAIIGIIAAYVKPTTKISHSIHILLSTCASLFHMVMAKGSGMDIVTGLMMTLFLFISVWIPCCSSDIIFPMFFIHSPKHVHNKTLCADCEIELHEEKEK